MFRNFLFHLRKNFDCFVVLSFINQFHCKLCEEAAMVVAHADDCLVEIETGLVDSTKLEVVHHCSIGLLRIEQRLLL